MQPKSNDWTYQDSFAFDVNGKARKTWRVVERFTGHDVLEQGSPNARLCAASPQLLEACQVTLSKLEDMTTSEFANGGDKEIRKLLENAIFRATKGLS